jgi:hypothetical protein
MSKLPWVFALIAWVPAIYLILKAVREADNWVAGSRYCRCRRCGRSLQKHRHSTEYDSGENWSHGCFALCERCWGLLSPEERLPFYRIQLLDWKRLSETAEDYDAKWPLIKKAVLAGK